MEEPHISSPIKLLTEDNLRLDGRRLDELRPIKLEVGVLSRADGSAYIEQGKSKILVAVYGPRELHPRHLAHPDEALLQCVYRMATFSVEERKSPAPSRREIELSKVITESLAPAVFLKCFPRASIDVYIQVIQADGGTRCSSITAASLALADAGIPLRDLVAACAAGKIDGKIALDLSDIEDKNGQADLPVAIMPRKNLVTLLQMDGVMTKQEFTEAYELALKGCQKIYELQREVLIQKYISIQEGLSEEENEPDNGG
ncbi:MAG: exosome complex exonuclease Rrp41 [Candidatus Jordarchaeaceae archaeon]